MAMWDLYEDSSPDWMFVIDLDDYAGNCSRDLSAYVVGQCDLCWTGLRDCSEDFYHKQFEKALEESPLELHRIFEGLVGSVVDDHGDDSIHRSPQTLVPSPGSKGGWPFNSVGIALAQKPTDTQLALLCERAKGFAALSKAKLAHRPKILGFRLIEYRTVIKTSWEQRTNSETGVITTLRDP